MIIIFVNQFDEKKIFLIFLVSYEYQKELQDEKDRTRGKKDESNQTIKRLLGTKSVDRNAEVNKKLLKAARILERMVNQVNNQLINYKGFCVPKIWKILKHFLCLKCKKIGLHDYPFFPEYLQ